MPERAAIIENEAFAAPTALCLRNFFKVFQNAALEVINLFKATRQQMGAGLLAADAAGAEHCDPAVLCRVEMLCDEVLEFPKTLQARIERAFEGTQRHFEGVAGVDDKRFGGRDQRIPVGRFDVDADLMGWIGFVVAESDDLLFQPDLQPLKRHRNAIREFQLEAVQSAAEQAAVPQLLYQNFHGVR